MMTRDIQHLCELRIAALRREVQLLRELRMVKTRQHQLDRAMADANSVVSWAEKRAET